MAKLSFIRRLIVEDFNKNDQELIGKLALILNPAFEAITNAFNGGITFEDNIASQVKDIIVTVDSTGKPLNNTSYKSSLSVQTKGIIVIRAINNTNVNTHPNSSPFISFTENSKQITINNVSGLQANNQYNIRILAIG